MKPIYIIAEAGVNHNGSREMAFRLVDVAVRAGADAVKFQTFKAENLVTKSAQKASYQRQTTDGDESQFSMLKQLELTHEIHHELVGYCQDKGIDFLSTAFDSESLNFLVKDIGLKRLKISSGEITNGPLLLEHALTGCDLILSTGMATLAEVEEALAVITFGLLNAYNAHVDPSRIAFQKAFLSKEGKQLLKEKVTLLHCTTEYPVLPNEINLNAILTMRNAFGLSIGYSDHSEGITIPIAATAFGATLIEKHFTLDKSLPGPDHKASLEPDELKTMVDAIRTVEVAMGNGKKQPMPSELKNIEVVRKSLVATSTINVGDRFTVNNVGIKRPGLGTDPRSYWDIIDTISSKKYEIDDFI
jgi:N-acetylneuraminate synthase